MEGLPLDASILKVSSWMGGALPQGTGSLGELGSLAEKFKDAWDMTKQTNMLE